MSLWRVTLVSAFFFALGTLSLSRVGDPDVWWHLETGKRIVESRAIPRVDPYSFTAQGRPWVAHEWGFEVIIYAVYAMAGVNGLIVAKVLLLASTFGLLLAYGLRRGFPLALHAPFLLLVAVMSMGRFTVRPHLFTYLGLALTLSLLHDYRDFGRNRLGVLPVVFLLWANVHSGFIFGLAALVVFTVVEAWSTRAIDRRLFLAVGGCVAAGFLNPNGYEAFLYPVRLALNPAFKGTVAEHLPIYHPAFRTSSFVPAFLAVVAVTAVAAIARAVRGRRIDRSSLVLCALFAAGAVLANRNRVEFGISAVPVVAGLFMSSPRTGGPAATLRAAAESVGVRAAVAVALFGFGLHVVREGIPLDAGHRRSPAFGVTRDTPETAADFIRRADLQGPMFNEYQFGGYLIWKLGAERPVFIDGRNDVYGGALMEEYRRILEAEDGFEDILERYGIEYVVLANTVFETDGAGTHPFLAYCGVSPGWVLVHADDAAVIYVRTGPRNRGAIERFGFRYVDPFTLDRLVPGVDPVRDRSGIERELERLVAEEPGGIEMHVVAANLHAAIGNTSRAIEIYRDLARRMPRNADVAGNLGVLLARAGRKEEAEEALREAARRGADASRQARWERLARESFAPEGGGRSGEASSAQLRVLVAAADSAAEAGDVAQAIVLYEEAIRLEPQSSPIRFHLGDLYWRAGRVDDCLREYHLALSLDSTSVEVLNNLGFVYGKGGDLRRAREFWTRAAAIDPEHVAAKNLRKLDELERETAGN